MIQSPMLALPNFDEEFVIETYASGFRIGAVLQQNKHPIAYLSKTLAPKHQSLSTYEKELLAMVLALQKWRVYLLDRHFKIRTDHFSLKYVLDPKITTPFQSKWLPKLLGFDYEIEYKKGKDNAITDGLSQIKRQGVLFSLLAVSTSNKLMDAVIATWSTDHGKSALLVVVDRLSKYAHFLPVTYPFTALQVAQLFFDNVYKLHGLPKTIVNDRDKEIDNPCTTMEEYVQFEIERALKNEKVYNWETVKYCMTNWCLEDVDVNILRFFELKFPAIVYNDALKLESNLPSESELKFETSMDIKTSSPKFNYEIYNSKADRKALKNGFLKKRNSTF
ncbi:putative mitochondrial protein [Tanacetum coccineum]